MMRLFVVMSLALMSLPAGAQAPPRADPPAPAAKPATPKPPVTLDSLFERLAKATSEAEGRAIASQIERRWLRSGSDTTDLLMSRVVQLMSAKDNERALDLLDYVIQLSPDWAEAYSRRATVFFLMEDVDGAMRDIRATLAREPRHFGALAGLGILFQKLDRPKAAFEAFSLALKLHPQMERLKGMVDRLKLEVEDRRL